MQDQRYFNLTAAVLVTVVVLGGFAVIMVEGNAASGSAPPTVQRNLTIAWDPATSSYSYSQVAIHVPLHARVIFTITSYDPDPATYVPLLSDTQVSGTNGGTMMVLQDGRTATSTGLPTGGVSHTFTISSGAYQVNVPIPVAPSSTDPVRVTFSVDFNTPGSFAWGCVILCGTEDMTLPGEMYGTLTAN